MGHSGMHARMPDAFSVRCLVALVAWLAIGACESRILYKDHPVVFDGPGDEALVLGDPELIPGTNDEQLFEEIADGDTVYIIHGFQGGTWVHLSLRVTGLPSSGSVTASLGSEIGEISYDLKLIRTAEGYLEAYDIPIPIPFEGTALEALYGQEVDLTVTFATSEGALTAVRAVVLGDG